jgi:argininosuccinate lyase
VRGASGVLIGRLTGFLAVAKSPSARSDNLIFAYGEVPRALDLSIRVTRLMSGVVGALYVNTGRLAAELAAGYTQATDLTEFIVQTCGVDYRSAYVVVGKTVREASRRGVAGKDITGAMLDEAAQAETGRSWGLADVDLTEALDARAIVATRVGVGGAAPSAVRPMIAQCEQRAADIQRSIDERRRRLEQAERQLLADAAGTAREATR